MSDRRRSVGRGQDAVAGPGKTLLLVVAATVAVACACYAVSFVLIDTAVDGAGVAAYGIGVLATGGCGWRVAASGRMPCPVGAAVGVVVSLLVAVAITILAFLAAPCPGTGC